MTTPGPLGMVKAMLRGVGAFRAAAGRRRATDACEAGVCSAASTVPLPKAFN